MSQKSYIEAQDSRLISNASQGGALPQIQSGEKRVGVSRSTFGSTASSNSVKANVKHPGRHKAAKRARIVYVKGVLTVVYE